MNGDNTDHDLLMHIDEKLTLVIDNFNHSIDDHEIRLRCMEKDQLKILGVGAITGFISGWFSRFLNGGSP